MYELKIVTDFAAAHNLRNFRGRCESLHGHNWKVEVVVLGKTLDDSGIVLDFGELKTATRELLTELDHHYLNDLPYFRDRNPSSENIATFLYQRLSERLDNQECWVYKVSAWESDDACATYIADRTE